MLLYNNQFIPEEELRLPLSNRAFQYHDGFFETVMVRNGQVSFWEAHLERIREAARALQLELPALLFSNAFTDRLLALAHGQQAVHAARIKLKIWRKGGGLYTPETNQVDWLATAQPASLPDTRLLEVGVCQQIHTLPSPFSHFKGPNAPLYVLAGLEKKARRMDDMLLLDKNGAVSELISANVWWIKDEVLYTPPLETGCVNGVLRRSIFRWCATRQAPVSEQMAGTDALLEADTVFASNVTGIKIISSIAGHPLATTHPIVSKLREDLFG
ncbi:aminotransferase class IV [Pontibacter sp. E15-1]|uniref:aminotransferase class IV n=1 Tax=Pontibacter sp. E15-1 TaxID=2919918 RepID=UPI001F4F9129|nr:aminotransferase class IV [Pontibacter sp. E15-1]MCJ8163555.1 aminotransferase class IV [Pontibacter sp. E15-1]